MPGRILYFKGFIFYKIIIRYYTSASAIVNFPKKYDTISALNKGYKCKMTELLCKSDWSQKDILTILIKQSGKNLQSHTINDQKKIHFNDQWFNDQWMILAILMFLKI